jgi:hypothetical protein
MIYFFQERLRGHANFLGARTELSSFDFLRSLCFCAGREQETTIITLYVKKTNNCYQQYNFMVYSLEEGLRGHVSFPGRENGVEFLKFLRSFYFCAGG